jgi:hypothetical protein
MQSILHELLNNIAHNLFKPLLLFFYMGFLVPILRVPFEFPKVIYQGLTIYLLVAIGWHGGEELASLNLTELKQAGGFMVIGFITNTIIGLLAYFILRSVTKLRRVDAGTVAAYYGSDSAGTFVTCVGVLAALNMAYAKYMPVMLAIMEIPGCLVGLALISRMRRMGMDKSGNMPDEPGYMGTPLDRPPVSAGPEDEEESHEGHEAHRHGGHAMTVARQAHVTRQSHVARQSHEETATATAVAELDEAEEIGAAAELDEVEVSEKPRVAKQTRSPAPKSDGLFSPKVLHEIFLNPGLYLLFGGIVVGFIGRLQGPKVTAADDPLFLALFQGMLCLFLLEMGMTACQRLRDLKTAGMPFIAFGLIAPNVFATMGIFVAHAYSHLLGEQFPLGTYPLFAVLCGAASYIAVPAIQRLAIPEASPTLPLAASLGLTFSYNVTIGIPIYIEISKAVVKYWPV